MPTTTWKPMPQVDLDQLDNVDRDALPDSAFAFPNQRREPMTDRSHVREALFKFDEVDATDADKDMAFNNILAAAKHFGVVVTETTWREVEAHAEAAHEGGKHAKH